MKHAGDFISANQFSVGELREALFSRNPRISPILAVNLLSRKSYPEKLADLAQVLQDSTQSSQVRYNAALELAKLPDEEARTILRAHVDAEDAYVRRGVSAALGRLGEPSAAAQPVQHGGLLERMASGGFTMPERSRLVHPDPKRAERIHIEPPPNISTGAIARQISAVLPGVDFKPALAQRLQCRQREILLVLNAAASADAVRSKPSSLVGAVMERHRLEADHWEARYFISAQQAESRDELALSVASPAGQLIAAGSARWIANEIEFEVATVDIPGIVPFVIAGRYRDGRIIIDEARSDTRARPRIEVQARPPRDTKSLSANPKS